jgi:large subunit ribosomal protein L15
MLSYSYLNFYSSLRRQYPPLSLSELQHFIDKNRIDVSKPIDIASIVKSGLYTFYPDQKHFGINLTDEGADIFATKLNIEVQWATEQVIAAIERNGGVITTAYYDIHSLFLLKNPKKFFESGQAIPRRMIPPPDAIEYYTSAEHRGYLADPEQISEARLKLAQKYGYQLPNLQDEPNYNMLCEKKDPRQIFYGLEPGWVVNLKDNCILKPKNEELLKFYSM